MNDYDVIVIGGGTAGVIAAVQAAREDVSTLLIEKSEMAGGTITNAAVDFPGLFHAWKKQIIKGIGWELLEKCISECGYSMPNFSEQEVKPHWREQIRINRHYYALLCDEMLADSGVNVLFDSMVASVTEYDDFKKITVCTKSGLKEYTTKVLIDCTGDADAVRLAGYETESSMIPQPATYSCSISGYDLDKVSFSSIEKAFDEQVASGKLKYTDSSRVNDRFIPSWLRAYGDNATHVPSDGIDSSTSEGRSLLAIEGRLSILRSLRFYRNQKETENIKLDYLPPECGIRESVRIKGKATITEKDYIIGKRSGDDVCYSFYPIDLHTSDENGVRKIYLENGIVPSVPRGALLPLGSRNFIVAGRCISSDQNANSALRVQATCMATGQAAGAMASLAVKKSIEVSELNISEIHEVLRRHGAIVPN